MPKDMKPIKIRGRAYDGGNEYEGLIRLTSKALEFRGNKNFIFAVPWREVNQVAQEADDLVTIFTNRPGLAGTHQFRIENPVESHWIAAIHSFTVLQRKMPTAADLPSIRDSVDEMILAVRGHQAQPIQLPTGIAKLKCAALDLWHRLTTRVTRIAR